MHQVLSTGGGYGGDGGYGGGRGGKYCINSLSQFDVFSYANNSITSDFNKVAVAATAAEPRHHVSSFFFRFNIHATPKGHRKKDATYCLPTE